MLFLGSSLADLESIFINNVLSCLFSFIETGDVWKYLMGQVHYDISSIFFV